MWPFFISKKQKRIEQIKQKLEANEHEETMRHLLTFENLLEGMERLDNLGTHDSALKFWLPESAAKAVDELSKLQGNAMSVTLREFLAVHAYGLYPVQLLLQRNPGVFKEPNIRFSVSFDPLDYIDPPGKKRVQTYFVPELGKNVVPIKLWIAACLRDDLQILAEHSGVKLSQCKRPANPG